MMRKKGNEYRFRKIGRRSLAAAAGLALAVTFAAGTFADELVSDENMVADDTGVFSDTDPEASGVTDGTSVDDMGNVDYSEDGMAVEMDGTSTGGEEVYDTTGMYVEDTYTDDAANVAGLSDGLLTDPGTVSGDVAAVSDGMTSDGAAAAQTAEEPSLEGLFAQFFTPAEPASSLRLSERLKELTKVESPAGSDGELITGQYIAETLQGFGYTVSTQSFHEGFLNDELTDVPCINILAEKQPNTENAGDGILLILTHFDSKTKPEEGDAFANDKTGAAVVLETAELVAGMDSDIDICFVFLSGEEDGNFGSVNFAEGIAGFMDRVAGVIYVGPVGYIQDTAAEAEDAPEAETEGGTEWTENAGSVTDLIAENQWKEKAFPYVLATPDGLENAVSAMLQQAVSDQALQNLDQTEMEMGSILQDGNEIAQDSVQNVSSLPVSLAWAYETDTASGCSAFYEHALPTVYMHQDFTAVPSAWAEEAAGAEPQESWIEAGTSPEGEEPFGEIQPESKEAVSAEDETESDEAKDAVQIVPDPEALREAADILANTIARYMAGMR